MSKNVNNDVTMNLPIGHFFPVSSNSPRSLCQPRPQGFSLKKWVGRPTHFSREKPWGRGWSLRKLTQSTKFLPREF